MLSTPDPWDHIAQAYEEELVPAFESVARAALDAAALPRDARVLDVAAGPGTLALLAARSGARVTAIDFAPRMIEALDARAAASGVAIDARVADGTALPFEAASFDAAFSLFGLIFFPDRALGFRELHRVLAPGGRALVSSWMPFDRSREMTAIYGPLAELAGGSERRSAPPLTDPEACIGEMSDAGFEGVTVREVEVRLRYPTTEAMIRSTLRSSAPATLLRRALGARWEAAVAELPRRVTDQLGPGPHEAVLGAYLTIGTR